MSKLTTLSLRLELKGHIALCNVKGVVNKNEVEYAFDNLVPLCQRRNHSVEQY